MLEHMLRLGDGLVNGNELSGGEPGADSEKDEFIWFFHIEIGWAPVGFGPILSPIAHGLGALNITHQVAAVGERGKIGPLSASRLTNLMGDVS